MKQGNLIAPPKTPNEPQGRDTFQTPNYATELLIPFIPKEVKGIWEPACGDGKIVQVLTEHGYSVYPSDIRKSTGWVNNWVMNFLSDYPHIGYDIDCIITNPPFSIKDDFIEKAFEYNVPFAFLINADYSQQTIDWIRRGCEKIVPTSRIAYITPNILRRIHEGEIYKLSMRNYPAIAELNYNLEKFKKLQNEKWLQLLKENQELHNYQTLDDAPQELLYRYSSAQFHSMWLCYGFGLGHSETFVDLSIEQRKTNI